MVEHTRQLALEVSDLTAPGQKKVVAWLTSLGVDPDSVREIVIGCGDASNAPALTVYRHARNADGKHYVDPETGAIALAEPVTVPLAVEHPPSPTEGSSP